MVLLCRLLILAGLLMSLPAFAQTSPKGAYVPVNGMDMYYEKSGTGDPLIVLHGAYMSIPLMGEIVPRLAQSHTVYAVEFQGHGRTGDIDRPITYQNLADDIAAFMDAVGLESADVFGYSMGGGTGLQLAIRHPGKVSRLISASAVYDTDGWQPVFKEFIPQMSAEMLAGTPFEENYRLMAPDPDNFANLAEKLIALDEEIFDWSQDIKELDVPILIIAGDSDVTTLEHTIALFRLVGGGEMGDMGSPLPPSRLAILPGSSHTAVIRQPDLMLPVMEAFLKGETPPGMFEQP